MYTDTLKKALLPALFLAGFGISAAQAEPVEYEFDKSHTQIMFFISHLGLSNQEGEFHDFDGSLWLDEQNPENSSVEVAIQTASIDMDSEKWDAHMKNEDFFHVEKFPTMTFRSTSVEVTGENTANMVGDLTILGVTKPVTLAVTLNKIGPHPRNQKQAAGFSATGTIKRSDFGMDYGLPMVGDEVQIRIETETLRAEGSAEAAE